MAKIKEFYYGFWTGGKPFEGKWYDGFVSEWHGPLKPYQYIRRYYVGLGGYFMWLMVLYGFVAVVWIKKFSWLHLSIAATISIIIQYLDIAHFFKKTYRLFTFCPRCQTGLQTADIYQSVRNRYFAGAFQRCPSCQFEREYEMEISEPVRHRASEMLDQKIPPPDINS